VGRREKPLKKSGDEEGVIFANSKTSIKKPQPGLLEKARGKKGYRRKSGGYRRGGKFFVYGHCGHRPSSITSQRR